MVYYRKYTLIIQDVDGNEPTPKDTTDIKAGRCSKCYRIYSEFMPIMFVRNGKDNRMRWWHIEQCVERPYKQKRKQSPIP